MGRGERFWIGAVFFITAAGPGCWMPVLSNVITDRGWGAWITVAFMLPQIAGIISPLILGAKADQKYAAEKVLAIIFALGSVAMFAAFWALSHAENPLWFLGFMMLNSLISAPAWSLITTIALSNLNEKGDNFGFFRVWGTIGWMVAGWLVSALSLDHSANAGILAAGLRMLGVLAALQLPKTPPKGTSKGTWRSALGFDSLVMLKDRDQAVYFATCFFFVMPISAFYMHTPIQLAGLGLDDVALGMSIGQAVEMLAMLTMGMVMVRMRVKWMLIIAMVCGSMRFVFYALGAHYNSVFWVLTGVAMQGICYPFFFETGRVFVNRRTPIGLKAQTQALLGFVSGGIGGLAGTVVVGALYQSIVVKGSGSWVNYWLILGGFSTASLVFFAALYRGIPVPAEELRGETGAK